jgi:hypothetical protein
VQLLRVIVFRWIFVLTENALNDVEILTPFRFGYRPEEYFYLIHVILDKYQIKVIRLKLSSPQQQVNHLKLRGNHVCQLL